MGVLAKNGWSFSALGGEYVTGTVEITGSFRSISIQGDAALELETVTGGKCKVTTDTGDIDIRIN